MSRKKERIAFDPLLWGNQQRGGGENAADALPAPFFILRSGRLNYSVVFWAA